MYAEKNDNYRSEYLKSVSTIPQEKRVYVDETGFDTPLIRENAYAPKGQRVQGERTGKRFARTSLIAGFRQGKHVAPYEFKGYCDTDLVVTWVDKMLIPSLSKGDVVIWDNATFHKSPRLKVLFEEAGIGLLFLPPYSPDYNPIEQSWSWLKSRIRALNEPLLHISQALTKVFQTL